MVILLLLAYIVWSNFVWVEISQKSPHMYKKKTPKWGKKAKSNNMVKKVPHEEKGGGGGRWMASVYSGTHLRAFMDGYVWRRGDRRRWKGKIVI